MLNMEKNQVVLMRKSLQRSVATAAISLLLLLLAACSGENKTSGGTSEETQIIAIEDRTVAGVSQKGPFLQGSSITVQELDGATLVESGKLYQTGKSFKGKIASDTGTFLIKDISLKSQFALLETEGFYRNEVTGEVSKSQITLNALVDLSERETANINLLTHLEYERVIELVGAGETIASAKKKAESEVFKAFGIEVDNASAEDLDIFAKGDDNAALLAISILMQGNLSEGELSNRLAGFASDIEKDGSWDDEVTKTDIADWASTADLAAIRANIRSWELGKDVPAFEKFFKRFWWNNFKLGDCNGETDGSTKKNGNELSETFGKDYLCSAEDWQLVSGSEGTGSNENGDVGDKASFEYGALTDSRDTKVYKTVKIGDQVWMAENLNYKAYGSVCYGEDDANCSKYGRLYTWGGAMDSSKTNCGFGEGDGCSDLAALVKAKKNVQGICPAGSHLPSYDEMQTMLALVGGGNATAEGSATAGTALKAKSGWNSGNGTDTYGFSALPAGRWENGYGGSFENAGEMTGFWSTNFDNYDGHVLHVTSGAKTEYWEAPKQLGYSVRCIVD